MHEIKAFSIVFSHVANIKFHNGVKYISENYVHLTDPYFDDTIQEDPYFRSFHPATFIFFFLILYSFYLNSDFFLASKDDDNVMIPCRGILNMCFSPSHF